VNQKNISTILCILCTFSHTKLSLTHVHVVLLTEQRETADARHTRGAHETFIYRSGRQQSVIKRNIVIIVVLVLNLNSNYIDSLSRRRAELDLLFCGALLNIYSALSISVDCLCAPWLLATLVCKRFWKNHVWRPPRPLPQAAGKFEASSAIPFVCQIVIFFMCFRSKDGEFWAGASTYTHKLKQRNSNCFLFLAS
jgi:hypothetical protein